MKRRGVDEGVAWPARLAVFRAKDWPPVRGEVVTGCMRECCRGQWEGYPVDGGRPGLEHDEFAYLDMDPVLAAIHRDDVAYGRFRAARLSFLGEDHAEYKSQVLDLMREKYRRSQARFAEYRALNPVVFD